MHEYEQPTLEIEEHLLPQNIYFVRHGQTTANVSLSMDRNPQLTALGANQAMEAGVKLSYLKPAVIIHTGLDRARETAELIRLAGGFIDVPVIEMDDFREREYGTYNGPGMMDAIRAQEGMEELFQKYGPSCVWFLPGDREGGMESALEVRERIIEGLREIKAQFGDQLVIIVSHEGAIKVAQCIYEGVIDNLPATLASRHIANCEVRNFYER